LDALFSFSVVGCFPLLRFLRFLSFFYSLFLRSFQLRLFLFLLDLLYIALTWRNYPLNSFCFPFSEVKQFTGFPFFPPFPLCAAPIFYGRLLEAPWLSHHLIFSVGVELFLAFSS